MKNVMMTILGIAVLSQVGCGSMEARTKETDKNMRIMIAPEAIDSVQYMQLTSSLSAQDNFTIVDRGQAYTSTLTEQNREHLGDQDRYADKEKWAHWGEMYGVGAIVVPVVECHEEIGFMHYYKRCNQFLTMVDANTAEVILAVRGSSNSRNVHSTPDWDDIAAELNAKYPKYFEKFQYSERIRKYQAESAMKARRD